MMNGYESQNDTYPWETLDKMVSGIRNFPRIRREDPEPSQQWCGWGPGDFDPSSLKVSAGVGNCPILGILDIT